MNVTIKQESKAKKERGSLMENTTSLDIGRGQVAGSPKIQKLQILKSLM
jgi:hypothetical protein